MHEDYLTKLILLAKEVSIAGFKTTMILRVARSLRPGEKSNFSVNKAIMISQGLDSIFVAINIGGWIIGGFSFG